MQLMDDLTYTVKPLKILDRTQKQLWGKFIQLVKFLWERLTPEEATWKLEENFQRDYLVDTGDKF